MFRSIDLRQQNKERVHKSPIIAEFHFPFPFNHALSVHHFLCMHVLFCAPSPRSADEGPLADKGPRTEMSCIVDVSMLCQAKELKKKKNVHYNNLLTFQLSECPSVFGYITFY